MAKNIRTKMAEEFKENFKELKNFILIDYEGIKAQKDNALRGFLNSKNIKVKVLKNTIAGVVFKEYFSEDLVNLLKRPTAIVFGENVVDVAKNLIEWNRTEKAIKIKGGYLSGKALLAKDVDALSKLPPREVLLALLAGSFEAPMQGLACVISAATQELGNAFNGLIDKLEKNEEKVES